MKEEDVLAEKAIPYAVPDARKRGLPSTTQKLPLTLSDFAHALHQLEEKVKGINGGASPKKPDLTALTAQVFTIDAIAVGDKFSLS